MIWSRARLRSRVLIIALGFLLLWIVLPYDNLFVLFVRWHLKSIKNKFKPPTANDQWLSQPPAFPIRLDEVGFIIKTGFSTQERLLARLATLGDGRNDTNVVIVGDYATQPEKNFSLNGHPIPVYDAIASMLESGSLSSSMTSPRLIQYLNLTAAITSGRTDLAYQIGKSKGWEIDIMKHVSGLELAYKLMPYHKWYIMLDDDTYLLYPSLLVILGHTNPATPQYIGNAAGDYKAPFAHGGSAIVISQAAMHLFFIQNPDLVSKAHLKSLTTRWGDELISKIAMKLGLFLDEEYTRFFNENSPRKTRIQADRFCAPIVSFHKMSPAQMIDAGSTFGSIRKPISWIDLWSIYNEPAFDSFPNNFIRPNWDYVGSLDESTISTSNVKTKEDCLKLCHDYTSSCLAWTWEAENNVCHTSPWMTLGEVADSKFSAPNVLRAKNLSSSC